MLAILTKRRRQRWHFPLWYAAIWLVTPLLAAPFGRVPLPYRATTEEPIQAQNVLSVLANRHYVTPVLKGEVIEVGQNMKKRYPELILTYLDANFPFVEGFPLLPHRSHDDGEKVDLAFVYRYNNQLTSRAPAFLGYGRCDAPVKGEHNQPLQCEQGGHWQYSLLPQLALPFRLVGNYTTDSEATSYLIRQLARRKAIKKIFIEPHLKVRWGLSNYGKVRYHGCAAVRHDDHIHVQL